jgi:hypothetical protein
MIGVRIGYYSTRIDTRRGPICVGRSLMIWPPGFYNIHLKLAIETFLGSFQTLTPTEELQLRTSLLCNQRLGIYSVVRYTPFESLPSLSESTKEYLAFGDSKKRTSKSIDIHILSACMYYRSAQRKLQNNTTGIWPCIIYSASSFPLTSVTSIFAPPVLLHRHSHSNAHW